MENFKNFKSNRPKIAPRGWSQYDIAVANFKSGAYGTPDKPIRGGSHRCAFWDAYHNLPSMKHVRGSVADAHARAGRDCAKNKVKISEDKVAVYHFNTQIQNVRMKETGIKRKKRQKDPRPTDFSRPSLKIHEAHNYTEYHLINGKKVILKNPTEKGEFITGVQMKSRSDVHHVFSGKKGEAITKQHIIGKSAIKKQVPLKHNMTYDELEESVSNDEQLIYHVTHSKHVAKIQKSGIMPMKTSNWVKAGDKERYGGGEVYAFSHKADAHAWAGRMDWAHNQKLGSGNISIITAHRPKDRKFEVDSNDPLSQAGRKGDWLKTHGSIEPHHIVSVEKYMPKKLGEEKVTFDKPKPTVKISKGGLGKVREVSRAQAELLKKQGWKVVKEDKIGKKTASAEQIAKKHGLTIDQVNAQLDKGVPVEREHTNSDLEAREIARDHVHEFPDYYDRLDKMEKKAKKDMKEETKSPKKTLKDYMKQKYVNAGRRAQKASERKAWAKGKLKESIKRKLMTPKEITKAMYPKQEVSPKEPLPVTLKGYERVKDGKFNILRRKKTDEGYDPEKEVLKNRIEAHKAVAHLMAKRHGVESPQATFHRALVKRYEKELVGEAVVKKQPKKKQSKKSWQADARLAKKSKDPKAIRNALKAHSLRNEEVANSVGGGMSPVIGGEGNIHGTDPIFGKPVRRKKYAGKAVFVVDPTTFHKAYLGKRKYEHYEKYLEGSPMADEIRAFGRKYWDEPIIIENEQTGAMVYLKYGSK